MRTAGLLLACALLWAPSARAVFNDSEPDRIDAEEHLDSEYFLDLQSFAAPFEWDRLWAGNAGPRYRINAASLDCCDLWIDQRMEFAKTLNDRLSFSYALSHLGDKDNTALFQWIALDVAIGRGVTFGIFGEPRFAKQDADIGAKIQWEPAEDWTLAARANAVDFNFNERGAGNQSYARKPATYDFTISRAVDDDRVRAFVEIDAPLIRLYPADNRAYQYRKTTARLEWRRYRADDWSWRAGYAYEYKREAETFTPDTALTSQDHHRKTHRLGAAAERGLSDRDRLEAGMDAFVRGGRSDFQTAPAKSSRWKRWEWQPYTRWRRTLNDWSVSEAAVFLSTGEKRRQRPSGVAEQLETLVEAKLGLGIDFLYGPSGRIGLYGTFDIDDAHNHFWDGGNIRAMFLF
jgi:hypothetical protein